MWKYVQNLSERNFAFLTASVVFLLVLVIFLPLVLIGIFQVALQGETRYTQLDVERVDKMIQNELETMVKSNQDWAYWDDTYLFAQDHNQDYIDENTTDSSIVNLGPDLFIVLNTRNEIVFAKYIDPETEVEAPPPFSIAEFLKAYPALYEMEDLYSAPKGYALYSNYPMLVVSHSILKNDESGPSQGTLIYCKLINSIMLEKLSDLAQRKVQIYPSANLAAGVVDIPPQSASNPIYVKPLDAELVAGYQYQPDLNGQPVLMIQVESPRDLYKKAKTNGEIFTGALVVLGLLLLTGTYHFAYSFLKSSKARRILEKFQAVVNQASEGILLVDQDYEIIEANPAGKQILGWGGEVDQHPNLKKLFSFEPALPENFLLNASASEQVIEYRCTRQDGCVLDLELSASQIFSQEGTSFSIVMRDITVRKKAEDALIESEKRYTLAANGSNDGLWDWNLMTDEIYYSQRWENMLGYEDAIIGKPEEWFGRVHADDLLTLQNHLSDHLQRRSEHFESEYRILHKDGHYRWMLARGVAVWDPGGFASRIAGSQTDITKRKLIEEQLRHDALHDALTGLGNRTMLIDHLQSANERKRRRPDVLFALFFLDLDRFKQVNDSLGHQVGDLLLIEVSKRLQSSLRTVDTVTRFSGLGTFVRIAGDEFVLLLEDFQSVEDIYKVAERIEKIFQLPFSIGENKVNISASIGLVIPDEPYVNAEDIIRDADIAMYRAKRVERAQIVRFTPEMYNGTLARLELENDLRHAIENSEFEVYFQPIYSMAPYHISGFEALVRWNHPQRGLLPPSEFITIAEETGLITLIDFFVLKEACSRMMSWWKMGIIGADVIISVNFSARQIMSIDLVKNVRTLLEEIGFDPKNLWMEITERTMVQVDASTRARLNELRKLGIRIEIDDFGTGYSSFSYLQELPVDGFKIDRSFIKGILGEGRQIVKSLVDLGHSLGMIQIAEGVETCAQRDYLNSLACDYAQGYLMSRPVTAGAIEEMMAKESEKEPVI
jgi:diguanylate cyclase (GGDEF)-like protein/PAS domain S-box-containing protein